ncbi:MAG TPA: DinB family protein [Ohtaekwangia sp.]|nr:DinB family protein [Ohtaekwangia sp.]
MMNEVFSPANVPPFYQGYVGHSKNYRIDEALQIADEKRSSLVTSIPEALGTYAYADGKWTIKEVLTHMMDAERVFCYRALCFSRKDPTPLPGFDENHFVPHSNAHARTIKEIAEAMSRLRMTTRDLFNSFTEEMLDLEGEANKTRLSVRAIGYIIAGHELHHLSILNERYLKQ